MCQYLIARYNDISSLNDPRVLHTNALWDTGATNCVITPSCAKSLNLKPVGLTKTHHAGGESIANVYLVTIALPNGVGIKGVRVTLNVRNRLDRSELLSGWI